MPKTVPDSIRAAASRERRSSLYRWMLDNFDGFSATVAEAGRPNWKELAKAFASEGLSDRMGKPPSAEGARLTWFKVRQAKDKKPVARTDPRPATPSPLTQPTTQEANARSYGPSGGVFRHDNRPATDEDKEKWGPAKK